MALVVAVGGLGGGMIGAIGWLYSPLDQVNLTAIIVREVCLSCLPAM